MSFSSIYPIIGIIAGILAIGGYIPYIISIVRKKTKPNKATWFIWAIVGCLLFFSYMAEGDQNAIWVPLGYFIGPLIVALLSFRYGYATWTRIDTLCIIFALLSLIPWIFSHNATFTLLINVFIDMSGAIPTIIKTYHEPDTEDFTAWVMFFLANTLEVIAITQWDISASYPIYLFLLAVTMMILIIKGKIVTRQREASID